MGPEVLIPIAFFFSAASIVKMVLRYKERRFEIESGGMQQIGGRDTSARLERIEQAIDAMALEVERISEGQRFTTRLLAERGDASAPRALPPQ